MHTDRKHNLHLGTIPILQCCHILPDRAREQLHRAVAEPDKCAGAAILRCLSAGSGYVCSGVHVRAPLHDLSSELYSQPLGTQTRGNLATDSDQHQLRSRDHRTRYPLLREAQLFECSGGQYHCGRWKRVRAECTFSIRHCLVSTLK